MNLREYQRKNGAKRAFAKIRVLIRDDSLLKNMVTKTKTKKVASDATKKLPLLVEGGEAEREGADPASSKAPSQDVPKKAPAKAGGRAVKKEESMVKLRIRLRAYENKILDSSVKQIMDTALRHDAKIVGPVPMPTEIKKYTVNRSPFIYKNSREQFEIRVHKRLIDILNPSAKAIEALTNLNLPSGVDIEVTMS